MIPFLRNGKESRQKAAKGQGLGRSSELIKRPSVWFFCMTFVISERRGMCVCVGGGAVWQGGVRASGGGEKGTEPGKK